SCLGDDALLAHAPGEQRLPERVVDLVRARVEQVLALEVDSRAAESLREPAGEVERRGTAGVGSQELIELELKSGVLPGFAIGDFQLFERGHENFGDITAAVDSE